MGERREGGGCRGLRKQGYVLSESKNEQLVRKARDLDMGVEGRGMQDQNKGVQSLGRIRCCLGESVCQGP